MKESEGWGPEIDGLRTRLLPAQKEFFVGRPAKFRLEMKNFGKSDRMYDSQGVSVNGSIRISGPDEAPVRYVAGSFQTSGSSRSIAPGQKVALFEFDSLDVADQYLMVKPGSYTLDFRGTHVKWDSESAIPPSGQDYHRDATGDAAHLHAGSGPSGRDSSKRMGCELNGECMKTRTARSLLPDGSLGLERTCRW